MENHSLPTKFLPAERSLPVEITRMNRSLDELPFVQVLVDSVPVAILILDKNRQIVLSNRSVLKMAGASDFDAVMGLRPGELLKCIHAAKEGNGCGTTEFCRVCGAANAILSSQKGIPDVKECHISITGGDALDLRVWTTPFKVKDDSFTIFSVSDITDEKRRHALERTFFHDIVNSLSAVSAVAEILKDVPPGKINEMSDIIFQATERAIGEINSQKDISAAEIGELHVKMTRLSSVPVLQEIIALYSKHEMGKDKKIVLSPQSEDVTFISDETLVSRVIGNMIKNALEASQAGEEIWLKSERVQDNIRFTVHNSSFIPVESQLQIFQRSFSTKGRNRGLGTYGMRLLSERYLKGKVFFVSTEEEGTTFYALYPLNPEGTHNRTDKR